MLMEKRYCIRQPVVNYFKFIIIMSRLQVDAIKNYEHFFQIKSLTLSLGKSFVLLCYR